MTTLMGGWTKYTDLSSEDKAIFDQAMVGFVGIGYVPHAVSRQIVNGMNYKFKCVATLPGSGSSWDAVVEIYASLPDDTGSTNPHITSIVRI